MLRRKLEIITLVAVAVVIAILAAGATRESTEAGNHPLPVASHNRIDPATMQLKVDIFNLNERRSICRTKRADTRAMSAFGGKLTWLLRRRMSAFDPKRTLAPLSASL